MPATRNSALKGRKRSKSPATSSRNSAQQPSVTNVNKDGRSARSKLILKCKSTDESNSVAEKRGNKKSKIAEVNARGKDKSPSPGGSQDKPEAMIPHGYENPTRVDFAEGGKIVTMTVDTEQESVNDSEGEEEVDYEDDPEVSFHQEQSLDESELDPDSSQNSQSETDQDESSNEDSPVANQHDAELTNDDRRKQIQDLDLEMKEKLIQMRKLLKKGGLTESAEEVERSLLELQERNSRKSGNFQDTPQIGNANANSNRQSSASK